MVDISSSSTFLNMNSDKNLGGQQLMQSSKKKLTIKEINNEFGNIIIMKYVDEQLSNYILVNKHIHLYLYKTALYYYQLSSKTFGDDYKFNSGMYNKYHKEARKYDDKLLHYCFAYYKQKYIATIDHILCKMILTYSSEQIKQMKKVYFSD